ncbi:hypothetical protein ACHAXT_010687 [Thalassiosira profunda]
MHRHDDLPSNATMQPQALTLSFDGVDFCLSPSVGSAAGDVSVSKLGDGDEVVIHLNQFSGSLRVKTKSQTTSSAAAGDALPATESLLGRQSQDDDASVESGPNPANEQPDGAAAPMVEVGDTPSPQQAKSPPEDMSDEKKPKRGQQKLNFALKASGRESKEKGGSKKAAAPSKRSPVDEESEPAERKKPRKSDKGNSGAPFDDIIEEPKNGPPTPSNGAQFSFGQTMPSQENGYRVGGDLSLDSKTMEMEASDNLQPEGAATTSLVSKKPAPASAPCPRWGNTMTMIDHNRFIVYGGQTIDKDETARPLADLFVYDLAKREWSKPFNCDGVARTWHTANFLPERQLLLCFGGEVLNEKTGKLTTTDQIAVLDVDIMLWYPPAVSGQVPSGRSGHASCVLPKTNELIVFGGVKGGKWLNSSSILDTNRWKWSTLKAVGTAPPPRSYHSATAIGDGNSARVVIFGGNDGDKCFDGVHVLEMTGKKWVWSHPTTKGDIPRARTGHDATLLNDGSTILVYGGWDPCDESGDDLIFGDAFLLDTKTWTWRKGPNPKYEKSTNNAANGGAERVGHSAVLAPGADGVQVLAFGGRLPENKFSSDFQSLVVPL